MRNQLNTKSKITSNYKSNLKNRLQNREDAKGNKCSQFTNIYKKFYV